MKKFISVLISMLLLLGLCINVYSNNTGIKSNMEYYNKDYDNYIKSLEGLSEEEYNQKILSAPSKYSYNEVFKGESNEDISTYNTRAVTTKVYDTMEKINMRAEDIGLFNSGRLGWAFSANDALEIYLRRNGLADENCDFSEQHMLGATYSGVVPIEYSMRNVNNSEGNLSMAAAYWMRGELNGPTNSPEYDNNTVIKFDEINNVEKENYYVTDTVTLSDLSTFATEEDIEERIDSIKRMVMTYGSVFMQYEHFDGAFDVLFESYNNNNLGNIQSGRDVLSGVVIVGWDDDYAISNFAESKPSRKGAFKVFTNRKAKKSEDKMVDIGTYYISYDMVPYFMDCAAVKRAYAGSYSQYTYEYDKKASKGVLNSNTTTNVYANKYKNNYGNIQKIKSITTYCEVPNSRFNVYISTDGNMENLQNARIKYCGTNGYLADNIGYVTLDLSDEIEIGIGSEFVAAIEVITPTTGAESIPQEMSPIDDSSIMGRCFIAGNINSIKSGNYIDCGSRNNIIKVHTNNVNRQWNFDDASFDSVKNKTVEESKDIEGLTINGRTSFSNSTKLFTGVKKYNFAYMYKSTDYNKNSLKFYVNGTSKIYVIGKSNDETKPRRLGVYSTATGKTEYITMDTAKGYCYTYLGGAGYIYLYSVDDTIRVYSVAFEDYDDEDEPYTPTKKWDFSDLYKDMEAVNNKKIVNTNMEYDGLYLYSDGVKNMEVLQKESNSSYGHRYFYALDLDGSGTDTYRTIGFDVGMYAEIYITAKSTGTESRKLFVTNEYYCEPETDLESDSLNVLPSIETYKIKYMGSGERIFLRSADEGIRILKIEMRERRDYIEDENPFVPSDIDELVVGTHIINMTFDGYKITGTSARTADVVVSSIPDYKKAVKLIAGEHFGQTSRIEFKVGSSDESLSTRPNRKIRVIAKAESTQPKLILCDEFGYIFGAYNMSTELKEYVFDYKDTNKTLYLYMFDNNLHTRAEIYSISKTDVDYYADDKTLTITRDSNGYGECILSVDNVADLSMYEFKLEYDNNVVSYVGFEEIKGKNNAIASDGFYISKGSSYIELSARYGTEKYNWSGIIGKVKFKFIGNDNSTNVKFSMDKYR